MAKVEIEANIEQVLRVNGKPGAKVTLVVPASYAASMPLGKVHISIETDQGVLFTPPAVRGTRGMKGAKINGKEKVGAH